MTEMLDRIAKALAEHCNGGEFASAKWYNGDQREVWRKAARAAIEAMREPTPQMMEAPRAALIYAGDYLTNEHEADSIWRAMIDAGLKHPSPQTADTTRSVK